MAALGAYPRWWPMHKAVSPKPVAAILPMSRVSPPLALARSRTSPVLGLASCQKYANPARSISSSSNVSGSLWTSAEAKPFDAKGNDKAPAADVRKNWRLVQIIEWRSNLLLLKCSFGCPDARNPWFFPHQSNYPCIEACVEHLIPQANLSASMTMERDFFCRAKA